MHPQIEAVIGNMKFTPGTVQFELTAPQYSPLGIVVGKVYYNTDILELINRDYRHGYPHNGGQHSFFYRGPRKDALAMLELIVETLRDRMPSNTEEGQVLNELSYISQEILGARPR